MYHGDFRKLQQNHGIIVILSNQPCIQTHTDARNTFS